MKKFFLLLGIVILVAGAYLVFKPNKTFAPQPTPITSEMVEVYLRAHITELAPSPAVLGGTWYVTDVAYSPETKTGTVSYEDGHIAEQASFTVVPNETAFTIELMAKNN